MKAYRIRFRRSWCMLGVACLLALDGSAADKRWKMPPGLEDGWYARIETSRGRIVARLLPEQAPQAVAHFVGLAQGTLEWFDPVTGEPTKRRYYRGIEVDRAVAGQHFEAGGLEGEADRVAPPLFIPPTEGHGPVRFDGAGRLGMTRAQGNRVSGVKFVVTAVPMPAFNRRYPCFGIVVEGVETVFQISQAKTYDNGRPVEPIKIRNVHIFTVGNFSPLETPRLHRPRLDEPSLRTPPPESRPEG